MHYVDDVTITDSSASIPQLWLQQLLVIVKPTKQESIMVMSCQRLRTCCGSLRQSRICRENILRMLRSINVLIEVKYNYFNVFS